MASFKSSWTAMLFAVALLSCLAERPEYVEVVTPDRKYVDITTNVSSFWLYEKQPASLLSAWKSVSVNLDFENASDPSYTMVYADSLINLNDELKNRGSWFWSVRNPGPFKRTSLDPFVDSYIGIDSSANYYISINIHEFDWFMFGSFLFGLVLYLMADRLSEITATYYVCAAMSSVLVSLVVPFVLIESVLPRRPLSLAFYWCGCTVSFNFWCYNKSSNFSHYKLTACYVVFVSVIAVIWVYRWRIPIHFRIKRVFRHVVQIVGAVLICLNCQYGKSNISILAALVAVKVLPFGLAPKWWSKLRRLRLQLFTTEDYEAHYRFGVSKTLIELRTACYNAVFGRLNAANRRNNRDGYSEAWDRTDNSLFDNSEEDSSILTFDPPLTSSRYSLLEDPDHL